MRSRRNPTTNVNAVDLVVGDRLLIPRLPELTVTAVTRNVERISLAVVSPDTGGLSFDWPLHRLCRVMNPRPVSVGAENISP